MVSPRMTWLGLVAVFMVMDHFTEAFNLTKYPGLWTDDYAFLNKPGEADIQSDLFYDWNLARTRPDRTGQLHA